jgi:hypothetical protein
VRLLHIWCVEWAEFCAPFYKDFYSIEADESYAQVIPYGMDLDVLSIQYSIVKKIEDLSHE